MNEEQSSAQGTPAPAPSGGDSTRASGDANGTGHADGDGESPNVRRAEEMVDRMAERMAQYTSAAGRAVLRWTARVREEAEDIWAEAQGVRRGKKP